MKDHKSSTDPIGQNVIKLISNVGFSVFVFSVLIFTIIAITYQPPDPWESSRALTRVFTEVSNATFQFQTDNSIARTGEDIGMAAVTAPAPSPEPPISQIDPLTEKSEEKVTNLTTAAPAAMESGSCDDTSIVNCSNRGVLTAIKKFNVKHFKSIRFLEYQTPVNGSNPDECDVSWRFRNKKEKSWRKYRDFRRFKIGYTENCTYKVVNARGWHSGINAKRSRSKLNATGKQDQINDTIPVIKSDSNFRNGKYLYYSRGGNYCKDMNHYIWSFLCAIGEAQFLNRTFVMDLSICLSSKYTSTGKNEEGKDFRFYFDFEHLKESVSIVEKKEFLKDWKKNGKKISVRKVKNHKITPMELKNDKNTIIWRQFENPEPENYWLRVCESEAGNYIRRPWNSLWKSKRIMNIVSEISGQMDYDFDSVHVIRGEKAKNKAMWPHLDEDTSPDSLVAKLQGVVQPWRNLYVATNERFYNHFDRLRSHYKVHLLDDYKGLWGNGSEWWNETRVLNGGREVSFDGYMRVEVDTEVFYRGKTQVETFYNLTKDCKNGINSC